MSMKFRLFRGGVFWILGGGGSADFIFMGARILLNLNQSVPPGTKPIHK